MLKVENELEYLEVFVKLVNLACYEKKSFRIRIVMVGLSIICISNLVSILSLYFFRYISSIEASYGFLIIFVLFTFLTLILVVLHRKITKKMVEWCEENEN